jgi:hypothetical protein
MHKGQKEHAGCPTKGKQVKNAHPHARCKTELYFNVDLKKEFIATHGYLASINKRQV